MDHMPLLCRYTYMVMTTFSMDGKQYNIEVEGEPMKDIKGAKDSAAMQALVWFEDWGFVWWVETLNPKLQSGKWTLKVHIQFWNVYICKKNYYMSSMSFHKEFHMDFKYNKLHFHVPHLDLRMCSWKYCFVINLPTNSYILLIVANWVSILCSKHA